MCNSQVLAALGHMGHCKLQVAVGLGWLLEYGDGYVFCILYHRIWYIHNSHIWYVYVICIYIYIYYIYICISYNYTHVSYVCINVILIKFVKSSPFATRRFTASVSWFGWCTLRRACAEQGDLTPDFARLSHASAICSAQNGAAVVP